jgi:hypothetical protein
MSGRLIPTDPKDVLGDYGTALPAQSFLRVKAAAALAIGDVVSWGQTADDGITVMDATAADPVAGVCVTAAAAAGDYLTIQTKGLNVAIITNNGTDVVAGDCLIPGAAIAVPVVAGGAEVANQAGLVFGQALHAETGTSCAAGTVMLNCFGT